MDSTRVVFHISNAGLDVEGSIAGVIGDIKFSKTKLAKSFFTATAKSETIQTGIKLRDKHLKKADYFDVENHPTIKITSKRLAKTKNGFDSNCSITIKGQTRDVNIPFTFKQTDNQGEFKGFFSLNRLDFGLGEKSIILSDTVDIEIWIGATLVTN
jgi:polyisoprenoid-binding protein YceI